MKQYLETAGRHAATPMLLPELSWLRRRYADRVRKFSEHYRKQLDDHVTATMRQWQAEVGPLAENDWLMFAMRLFDISIRQRTPHNDSQHHRFDLDFANFLELLDVDGMLMWNATAIHR